MTTPNRRLGMQLAFAILPIALSLLITTLLIIAVGSDPRAVFARVWEGAFRDSRALAGVANFWIPLALCSMGLVITFTAGLWNIGVEGQMMMGATFASGAALFVPLPAPFSILLAIALAVIGGMAWALLAGWLKLRLGVHEIFGGVALNALANVIAIYLISGPWSPPEGGSAQATAPFSDAYVLPGVTEDFPVSLLLLLLCFAAIALIAWLMRATRWGLQWRATGKNARSALLLGVPTDRSTITAFMLCGALAGLAGGYRVLFTYASLRPLASGGIGFLGTLVVLLAANRALLAPLIAFGFAVILAGSTRLKVALQLDTSLAGVLQGTVVLLVLLTNGLRARLAMRPAPPDVSMTAEMIGTRPSPPGVES